MINFPKRGLYVITPANAKPLPQLLIEVEAAIRGGAKVIQYREKAQLEAYQRATALLSLCHRYHIPLIINDSITLAAEIGADGVHLGQEDGTIDQAKQSLGDAAIIGISCYNQVERAIQAQDQGANYVAFGRFFSSESKPLATPANIETLIQAKKQLTIPIVAIGGILPENATALLNAGADLIAVIHGIFADSVQVESAALAYQTLFKSSY
ncbi:MAG: hypothetical protein RL637_908 [Pseudomonadota bacterium]|jgi:thiamine-phosphate pyrophosphorylase